MKRTLNRILALGMAICMLLSLVVVQASAATTTDGLQSQISAAAGSSVQIVLDGEVTLDQTIQIPAKTAVTITTDGAARTVKRGEGLTAAMSALYSTARPSRLRPRWSRARARWN